MPSFTVYHSLSLSQCEDHIWVVFKSRYTPTNELTPLIMHGNDQNEVLSSEYTVNVNGGQSFYFLNEL